ncbi:hypothetical protein [Amycolatopsis sp. H20-H5]|uniref:hypothetical protein n=1 Tax=Amycolatopsis sp. H20-H5 TaxID=3046309 RepID=UPI003FA39CD9
MSRKREGDAGRLADLQDLRGDDDGGSRIRVPYAELPCHSNFSFLDGPAPPNSSGRKPPATASTPSL